MLFSNKVLLIKIIYHLGNAILLTTQWVAISCKYNLHIGLDQKYSSELLSCNELGLWEGLYHS